MGDPTGVLVAEQLLVGHGEVPVCAPVDLHLPAGRALAVVGPNGSGKSTLLQTLAGLLPPWQEPWSSRARRSTSGGPASAATWPRCSTTTPSSPP
nr:ATP-binding cassette domain-containing protein [Geodermatophilus sp. TF02-6]